MEVDAEALDRDPVARRVADRLDDLGCPHERLRGDASDVHAGAAEVVVLEQHDPLAERARDAHRGPRPGATADHGDIGAHDLAHISSGAARPSRSSELASTPARSSDQREPCSSVRAASASSSTRQSR